MDGLVSTGNKFPDTILKIILSNQKIFPKYFIHILRFAVDKQQGIKHFIIIIYYFIAKRFYLFMLICFLLFNGSLVQ